GVHGLSGGRATYHHIGPQFSHRRRAQVWYAAPMTNAAKDRGVGYQQTRRRWENDIDVRFMTFAARRLEGMARVAGIQVTEENGCASPKCPPPLRPSIPARAPGYSGHGRAAYSGHAASSTRATYHPRSFSP